MERKKQKIEGLPRMCRIGLQFWRKRNKRASRCRTIASVWAASSPAQGSPQGTNHLVPGLGQHGPSRSGVWAPGLWTHKGPCLLGHLFRRQGKETHFLGIERPGQLSLRKTAVRYTGAAVTPSRGHTPAPTGPPQAHHMCVHTHTHTHTHVPQAPWHVRHRGTE